MTPRALMTSIGATALVFASAIGIATGSASTAQDEEAPATAIAFAAPDEPNPFIGIDSLATRNGPCTIAL